MTVQPTPVVEPNASTGNNKAYAAIIAGAATTIIVYAVDAIAKTTMPPDIVAAIQTLVTVAAVYFTPHGN